jgi:hypothetical protein
MALRHGQHQGLVIHHQFQRLARWTGRRKPMSMVLAVKASSCATEISSNSTTSISGRLLRACISSSGISS